MSVLNIKVQIVEKLYFRMTKNCFIICINNNYFVQMLKELS